MGTMRRPRCVVAVPFAWPLVGMRDSLTRGWIRTLGLPSAGLYLKILLFLTAITLGYSQCRSLSCSEHYTEDRSRLNSECEAVKKFSECIHAIEPSTCHGELSYHSTLTVLPELLKQNCAGEEIMTAHSNKTTTSPNMCQYKGSSLFRHCGLFGDPHLRTFDDTFLTCKAAGAWPLIHNDYLAVQVTNVPLTYGQGATATSRLIVTIKENQPCTEKKTYEVQSGQLPKTFRDGTRRSGSVYIATRQPGEHIEIHIKHIATVIIVRQVGKYITFAIKMPDELIRSRGENDIQLCVKGCPQSERIDYADFLVQTRFEGKSGEGHSTEENFASIRDDAVSKCRKAGVIDVYLDSCVFDLITTGDSNFTKAAQSALSDMKLLNPDASSKLHNRTSVFEQDNVVWRHLYDNAAPSRTITWHFIFYEIMLAFIVHIFYSCQIVGRIDL